MDSLKQIRTQAKRAVTNATRHLRQAVALDMSSIVDVSRKLELAYLNFLTSCDDFNDYVEENEISQENQLVNGLSPRDYEKEVEETFRHTMDNIPKANILQKTVENPQNVQFRRMEIPSFSGKMRDWPEFKNLWQELVVVNIKNKVVLARELKEACKNGDAYNEIRNVSAGSINAYDRMWSNLCQAYDNVVLAVTSAIEEIQSLKPVKDESYQGTVDLIDRIDAIYQQLEVLHQTEFVSHREVAEMSTNLPPLLARQWAEVQFGLEPHLQLRPFQPFCQFLITKKPMLKYLADTRRQQVQGAPIPTKQKTVYNNAVMNESEINAKCVFHDSSGHSTEICQKFRDLSIDGKRTLLSRHKRCFRCFGTHNRAVCKRDDACGKCARKTHHTLMCNPPRTNGHTSAKPDVALIANNNCKMTTSGTPLYAIYSVGVASSDKKAIVFCDGGSEASFITNSAAKALNAQKVGFQKVEIITLSGSENMSTNIYELEIRTKSGKKTPVTMYGLPTLSGPISPLDTRVMSDIFPNFTEEAFKRPTGNIDILLGTDYFGLHPKRELASDGNNLSIMEGDLGVCLQGHHESLGEQTLINNQNGIALRVVEPKFVGKICVDHPELAHNRNWSSSKPLLLGDNIDSNRCIQSLACSVSEPFTFCVGEELGTTVNPKCGSCKCGRCPLAGHNYSFKEEQELKLIQQNLHYDQPRELWVTSYPWLVDPGLLPNNYHAALATLRSTEKRLLADPEWGSKYSEQIEDMSSRGVARKLTQSEIDSWKGPVFYLSHLAVENPKSKTTPVRIVFNSSQNYRGVSLNSFLAKGPDSYKTNLLGVLLRFREERVVLVGDIRKMYNSVFLEPLEQHTHRFLWRDLEGRTPDIWCITRVNMGDKPAGAIAVEAKDMTADMFKHINPQAATTIVNSAYVDDLIDSVPTIEEAKLLTKDIDIILNKGGFKIKEWQFGGIDVARDNEELRVLGINYDPVKDIIFFRITLNFSPKHRGIRTGPKLENARVGDNIPTQLTRRMILEQVMGIFDPLGLLSPFILISKVYLRETWVEKLGWDEPVSPILNKKWQNFFSDLFEVETIKFPRCLKPTQSVGDPMLIILSDGSELAYGCAAYIRWELEDGSFWSRLIMAKCRIAPVNRISIPQMELNGAVLSKRLRKVIETEMRYTFSHVLHLVDSETILNMLHKLSTRFKVYEGVRIGEIQSATGGDISCWGWIAGKLNVADWTTRVHSPKDLSPESEWYRGPNFLRKPIGEWGVKHGPTLQNHALPGEKKILVNKTNINTANDSYARCSRVDTVVGAIARIINCFRERSLKGGNSIKITPDLLREAELFLIKEAQKCWSSKSIKDQFRTFNPVLKNGVWVIGTRISHASPLTPENLPQILLPYNNPLTKGIMGRCHVENGHRGRDSTLAKFRSRFWTPRGAKMSKMVCDACQTCKLYKSKNLSQTMGQMPSCRLLPSPPFTYTMVDLFGPFVIRGEVQKRTSGKVWGVIFTDLCCRAVHLEVTCGYDAQSFLMAFSRFASIRGWPLEIYSDPGSQLKASSELINKSSSHGVKWIFSPADSPWRQGAAEALIKTVKRALQFTVRDQRLSLSELLTVFTNIANELNERPIGTLPSTDSVISVLTPNCLLLGRSTANNPGGYEFSSLYSRLRLAKSIEKQFWEQWTQLYAPTLLQQRKWKHEARDMKVGDVVLVIDPSESTYKGRYKLARVVEVFPGKDGNVRRVSLAYKTYRIGERINEYRGARDILIQRSVQSLILLVPVEP